jgi:histidinol-phosphate aminotransferase
MSSIQSILNLATAGVQSLVPYQPGKPVSELQRELGLEQIVKLASNENPLGPGANAVSAIQSAIPELARYPDGNGFDLKKSLAKKYSVHCEQITLGNGSNEILELVARAFVDVESEIIFSQHAFAVYPLVTQAIGAKPSIVPAVDYAHDLQAMLASINTKTRLVFIASPNNPTGTYLTAVELLSFLQQLPQNIICVLDEAYYEYAVKKDYPDSIKWLDDHPNLLITRTFSKAYGLAGLRIGYSLSSPEMADVLNRVRQPFNNNALALAAAQAALHDQEFIQHSVAVNNQGMKQLTDAFKHLDLQWIPSAGNFVSVDLQQPGMPIYEALLHKGVIVRPVSNYEMPNHLRISIGTSDENQLFINALGEVLADV